MKRIVKNKIEIEWKRPANDICTVTLTGYDVSVVIRDRERRLVSKTLNTTKNSNFTIVNMVPKFEYNVTVRARTSAGPGPFTTPYIITFSPAESK